MKSLSLSTVSRLLSLVRPYRIYFILALIALALGSGVNLAFPEIIRRVLNAGSLDNVSVHSKLLATGLLTLFAFQGLCFYFRIYYFGLVGQRVVTDLRANLFRSIVDREIDLFDHISAGDLVSRLINDTSLMQDAVSVKLSVLIRYSLQVLIGLGLMIYMSPRLTFSIVISLMVLVGLSMVLGKRLRVFSKQLQSELGTASSTAQEVFTGIKVVKAYAREQFSEEVFLRSNERINHAGLQRISLSAFFQSFVNFLMNGALVLVLLYGIFLASNDVMTFGDLTSFLLYGAIVAVSFAFAVSSYTELVQAVGGAERVFEFLDAAPQQNLGTSNIAKPVTQGIAFDRVSFAYPTRPEHLALEAASFCIPAGKTTAIVGASGSGKSTITNLLLRFYEPNDGSITLDGIPLSEISLIDLRQTITLIPQDATLFGLTIRENLLFGDAHATMEMMREAAAKAAILDKIESLPQGFESKLGQHGASLSGGEKQRLAIARGLLRNPEVLIMDESTSALDTENEQKVQQALQGLMQGRTSIIIAHRLSTIKNAQHIIVLESGSVVQEGDYEALTAKPGYFQDFVRLQERRNAA